MTENWENNFVLGTFVEMRRKILIWNLSPVVIIATQRQATIWAGLYQLEIFRFERKPHRDQSRSCCIKGDIDFAKERAGYYHFFHRPGAAHHPYGGQRLSGNSILFPAKRPGNLWPDQDDLGWRCTESGTTKFWQKWTKGLKYEIICMGNSRMHLENFILRICRFIVSYCVERTDWQWQKQALSQVMILINTPVGD